MVSPPRKGKSAVRASVVKEPLLPLAPQLILRQRCVSITALTLLPLPLSAFPLPCPLNPACPLSPLPCDDATPDANAKGPSSSKSTTFFSATAAGYAAKRSACVSTKVFLQAGLKYSQLDVPRFTALQQLAHCMFAAVSQCLKSSKLKGLYLLWSAEDLLHCNCNSMACLVPQCLKAP